MTDMSVEYVAHQGTDLTVVNAARVSMDKESDWVYCGWEGQACTDACERTGEACPRLHERDAKLIQYLADHKHTSCFEHQAATLRLKVPIFIARQIQRHRTFSYNEVSRRYVKDNLEFYWPDKWRKAADNVKQGSSDETFENPNLPLIGWDSDSTIGYWLPQEVVALAVEWYEKALEDGMCAEQARMILPQNLMTSFYMTGNLRSWAHFLDLRLDEHAQKEVRDVAGMIEAILRPLWPVSMKALMT